ncbi:MAG: hypothetical protein ABI190_02805 [Casimicrobiaceae bacterium]
MAAIPSLSVTGEHHPPQLEFIVQRHLTLVVCMSFGLVVAGPSHAADRIEPATGLPVFPQITDITKMEKLQHYCGKAVQLSDADVSSNTKVAAVVSWYATNLSGAKHYQVKVGGDSNRTQDTFFLPDGLREVTITGTPNSDAVFAISYGRFASALTPKEMAGFNTGKQACGS